MKCGTKRNDHLVPRCQRRRNSHAAAGDRPLPPALYPDWHFVVSSDDRDRLSRKRGKHFSDLAIIYWPFDFTWAVASSTTQRVHPPLVVLAEGELWPNFLQRARWRLRYPQRPSSMAA